MSDHNPFAAPNDDAPAPAPADAVACRAAGYRWLMRALAVRVACEIGLPLVLLLTVAVIANAPSLPEWTGYLLLIPLLLVPGAMVTWLLAAVLMAINFWWAADGLRRAPTLSVLVVCSLAPVLGSVLGGLLAHEAARRLRADGCAVDWLDARPVRPVFDLWPTAAVSGGGGRRPARTDQKEPRTKGL